MIVELLLTVSVTDLEQSNYKDKSMLYTEAYIELYYWQNYGLVYKTQKGKN